MESSSTIAGALALGVRNDFMVDDKRGVKNGVLGKDQVLGSSTANASRINLAQGVIRAPSDQQNTRKLQSQVIRWEKFFPSGSMKVLLVENDDSTRHVLSALLRNCSYEVIAVADGFHAWKILEDETTHVDLVLTEVVMPFISGVGLLSKIMSHQSFKDIPVIMMSSHDSMGIVFKCLSKGAADFLVKPIRKNELKNLWQHVWRRCRSSTGSVSACDMRIKRPTKSKNDADYERRTSSSIERENESIGFSTQDESDDGNYAQSSWREISAGVDSPQLDSCNQLVDALESSCAQVLQKTPEITNKTWVSGNESNEVQEKGNELDKVSLGKDLKIGVPVKLHFQLELQPEELLSHSTSKSQDNLIDEVNRTSDIPSVIGKTEVLSRNSSPSLALALKRRRDDDLEIKPVDKRNILRHSNMSAFSRYGTGTSLNQSSKGSNINNVLASGGQLSIPKSKDINIKLEPLPTFEHCQSAKSKRPDDVATNIVEGQPKSSGEKIQVQHHHHHYHLYHHHHVYESSDAIDGEPIIDGSGDPIMIGSVSGSNTGSNGQKGSSTGLDDVVIKMENDITVAENSRDGAAGEKIGRNGGHGDRFAHRKAALTKFRQKRNERCFKKKVRYQNRKKMAEQRPRIRGQFVHKIMFDAKTGQDSDRNDLVSEKRM